MKSIKVAVLGVALLSAPLTFAQHEGPSYQKHHLKEMNLTEDQKSNMKAIHDSFKLEVSKVNQDTSLSKQDKKKRLDELRVEKDNKTKAVLSEEQFIEYQTHQKETRSRSFSIQKLSVSHCKPVG